MDKIRGLIRIQPKINEIGLLMSTHDNLVFICQEWVKEVQNDYQKKQEQKRLREQTEALHNFLRRVREDQKQAREKTKVTKTQLEHLQALLMNVIHQ